MDDANLTPIQIILIILIPSFVTALPSIISAIGARKDKRKRVAESLIEEGTAAEKVSTAWEKLAGDLQGRIDRFEERLRQAEEKQEKSEAEQLKLNARLNRQRKRINYLEDGVQILITQLRGLGVEPNFILKDEEDEKGE